MHAQEAFMPDTRLEISLPPSAVAPAAARGALGPLAAVVEGEVLESVRLLVSELVTNSVLHASLRQRDLIHLRVEADEDSVRVGVTDPGPGFEPLSPSPGPDAPFGWGLYLVTEVADRWGVERSDGTTVWFEIDRPRSDNGGLHRT
jgi:anti-sigma regulatory factor (Ser/Thr protein kinase)